VGGEKIRGKDNTTGFSQHDNIKPRQVGNRVV